MKADDLEGIEGLVSNVDRQWTGDCVAVVDGGQQSSIGENGGGKVMG